MCEMVQRLVDVQEETIDWPAHQVDWTGRISQEQRQELLDLDALAKEVTGKMDSKLFGVGGRKGFQGRIADVALRIGLPLIRAMIERGEVDFLKRL